MRTRSLTLLCITFTLLLTGCAQRMVEISPGYLLDEAPGQASRSVLLCVETPFREYIDQQSRSYDAFIVWGTDQFRSKLGAVLAEEIEKIFRARFAHVSVVKDANGLQVDDLLVRLGLPSATCQMPQTIFGVSKATVYVPMTITDSGGRIVLQQTLSGNGECKGIHYKESMNTAVHDLFATLDGLLAKKAW